MTMMVKIKSMIAMMIADRVITAKAMPTDMKNKRNATGTMSATRTMSAMNSMKAHRRIPEEHFRAHFGREHRFVIVRPVIVAGHPRFQYDGYWFAIARPLPPGWHYTDQVYVDYVDNNYYVLSPVHPGVRISINIL